ncbi:sigma-70 family RNA polymerase sigma factor [Streptomyces sp. NPDC051940]|uniref:sigma-70 family RNA polymerase sigma factor n=1 Tax=Streptomyces sp. NPDC051940 TaxID=3155675 RepID=UPI003437B796
MADDIASLAGRFEEERQRLRAVAYRMLGSLAEADDAVQEAWLRLDRSAADEIANLPAWLTTVVSRVCLNMLRSRRTRGEEPLEAQLPPTPARAVEDAGRDPEQEALMADSVGVALLVVLDTLTPAERLSFVLHDMFSVPFDEIGPMIERTPAAARQLASRARRRVRGGAGSSGAVGSDSAARRLRVVDAFLAATRGGDLQALVSLLHPDVVLYADAAVIPTPEPVTVRGAQTVAQGAMAATGRARFTGVALLDGAVGLVMAPLGELRVVLAFSFAPDSDLIDGIDVVAEPERLKGIEVAVADAA